MTLMTEPEVWARKDIYDVGAAYRALVGLPGGIHSPWVAQLQLANEHTHNMSLIQGLGNDPDTLLNNTVYIMDSEHFPFTQAEVCLQFHDDNPAYSPVYSKTYHQLQNTLLESGRLINSSCPTNYIC